MDRMTTATSLSQLSNAERTEANTGYDQAELISKEKVIKENQQLKAQLQLAEIKIENENLKGEVRLLMNVAELHVVQVQSLNDQLAQSTKHAEELQAQVECLKKDLKAFKVSEESYKEWLAVNKRAQQQLEPQDKSLNLERELQQAQQEIREFKSQVDELKEQNQTHKMKICDNLKQMMIDKINIEKLQRDNLNNESQLKKVQKSLDRHKSFPFPYTQNDEKLVCEVKDEGISDIMAKQINEIVISGLQRESMNAFTEYVQDQMKEKYNGNWLCVFYPLDSITGFYYWFYEKKSIDLSFSIDDFKYVISIAQTCEKNTNSDN